MSIRKQIIGFTIPPSSVPRSYDGLLIRYGELSLKGAPVRRSFEKRLVHNISACLSRKGVDFRIRSPRGRIVVETEDVEGVRDAVERVFGIVSYSPYLQVRKDLESIKEAAAELASRRISPGVSFAVRCTRADKSFPVMSQDVNAIVGSEIQRRTGGSVNLTSPQITIGIDIRDRAYLFDRTFLGQGGLPLGTAGKVLSLLSGGIDSAVATFMMMRRGCETVLVYMDNSPFGTEGMRKRAIEVANVLGRYCCGSKMELLIVPHGHSLLSFIKRCPRGLTCTLCKRMMVRVAEALAGLEDCEAIVNGSSLGQVASQTLRNLALTVSATKYPVLLPLIGFDKEEIIHTAKAIGTYEPSIAAVGSCTAVPSKPRTAPTLKEVLDAEESVDLESLVKKSLDGIQRIRIC